MNPRAYARQLRPLIEKAAQSLGEAEALEAVALYPEWHPDMQCLAGEKLRYAAVLYKILQNHKAQADWTPDVAVSLFAPVLIPDPEVIPEWVQPGSTNPYMKGDKVRHFDRIWVSNIDGNVWEPGVAGSEALWSEVS